MIDRHAQSLKPTKCIFMEQAALARSGYAAQSGPPELLHVLDACVCLPDLCNGAAIF